MKPPNDLVENKTPEQTASAHDETNVQALAFLFANSIAILHGFKTFIDIGQSLG